MTIHAVGWVTSSLSQKKPAANDEYLTRPPDPFPPVRSNSAITSTKRPRIEDEEAKRATKKPKRNHKFSFYEYHKDFPSKSETSATTTNTHPFSKTNTNTTTHGSLPAKAAKSSALQKPTLSLILSYDSDDLDSCKSKKKTSTQTQATLTCGSDLEELASDYAGEMDEASGGWDEESTEGMWSDIISVPKPAPNSILDWDRSFSDLSRDDENSRKERQDGDREEKLSESDGSFSPSKAKRAFKLGTEDKIPFTMDSMSADESSGEPERKADTDLRDWDSQSAMYHMESDSDSEQQKKSKYGLDEYINSTPPKSPDQLKLEENKNAHITDKLAILERNCESRGDKWRSFAYAKAGRLLKNAKFKVTTVEEAKRLPGIGSRIAEKIGEILATGTLRRIEVENNDEQLTTLNLFSKIFGAGPKTVHQWYAAGCRTLEDLESKVQLTRQQQIGLNYYHDFQERIPRDEVTQLGQFVVDTSRKLDPGLKVVICGSYRRGASTCGDIDILITHRKTASLTGILPKLVRKLHELDFLTDDLTRIKTDNEDKYMGVCHLPPSLRNNSEEPKHRRIDLKTFVKDEWACALLYFTGSGHFNRSIRLWARKCGMSLSEHALVQRYANDVKGAPIPVKTEEDVFKALGLDYKAPEERDI